MRNGLVLSFLATAITCSAWAQDAAPAASAPAASAAKPAAAAATKGPYRALAPWIMRKVDPQVQLEEAVSRHDVVELLAADGSLDWAREIPFRRDVWHLDFEFKPIRYIWVDIPQAGGVMQRKLIRYLVYKVSNPGKANRTTLNEDGTYKPEQVDLPVRFIPRFYLELPGLNKSYPDRVVPLAVDPIRLREDSHRRLLTTVEISGMELKVNAEPVWGVAMWEEIDPRLSYFSVYVEGLTNAYRWQDREGEFKPGDPLGKGRTLARKTLKLNFWRPGDEFFEHEEEVRYGAPGQVDYEWIYR